MTTQMITRTNNNISIQQTNTYIVLTRTKHAEVFRGLHACYADESGEMSFPMLLQFANDFHLTPAFASSHFLKKVQGEPLV